MSYVAATKQGSEMNTATQLLEEYLAIAKEAQRRCPCNTNDRRVEDIEAYLAKQQVEQEPVAWTHSCNALCVDGLELWCDHCPHCCKPRTRSKLLEPMKFEYFKDWMVKEMPPLTTIGNPEWWAKRIYDRFIYTTPQASKTIEPVQYLCGATRFKLSFDSDGSETSLSAFSRELQGKWVALVDATDNKHLAAPQAREPMSEGKISKLHESITHQHDLAGDEIVAFARAIEAHHGIK